MKKRPGCFCLFEKENLVVFFQPVINFLTVSLLPCVLLPPPVPPADSLAPANSICIMFWQLTTELGIRLRPALLSSGAVIIMAVVGAQLPAQRISSRPPAAPCTTST